MNLRTLSHLPDDLGTLGAPAVITPADKAERPAEQPTTPFERYMRSTTLPDNWERALEQTFDAGRTLGREEMREAEKQAKSQDAVVRRPIWESGSSPLPKPPLGPCLKVGDRVRLLPGALARCVPEQVVGGTCTVDCIAQGSFSADGWWLRLAGEGTEWERITERPPLKVGDKVRLLADQTLRLVIVPEVFIQRYGPEGGWWELAE